MWQFIGAERAASLTVSIMVIPSSLLLAQWWGRTSLGRFLIVLLAFLPAGLALGERQRPECIDVLGLRWSPLTLGLNEDRQKLVAGIITQTTTEARILFEESDCRHDGWNWTALLPVLTDRSYLGGLDPEARIEHNFCRMNLGTFCGKRLGLITTEECQSLCRKYNIGWVITRSPIALDFWSRQPGARPIARFRDGDELVLFEIDRPRTFLLAGSASIERCDRHKVVLTDVVPNENGEVILSMHYHPETRIAPSAIHVEGAKDLFDAIPMIKIVVPGPLPRVVLTWGR
jgi:hypothetical protein